MTRNGISVAYFDEVIAPNPGGDPGLAPEALAHIVAGEGVGSHDLEGEASLRLHVDDLVDIAHTAGGDMPDDTVALCEDRSSGEG
jgi:hypothetical protein